MILADTSVWVEHLRSGTPQLAEALDRGQIVMHPMVLGELACGNLRFRSQMLDLFSRLTPAPAATDKEALAFIERHRLHGVGVGYVDVHLVASTMLASDATLWTRDRSLREIARKLGIAYDTPQ